MCLFLNSCTDMWSLWSTNECASSRRLDTRFGFLCRCATFTERAFSTSNTCSAYMRRSYFDWSVKCTFGIRGGTAFLFIYFFYQSDNGRSSGLICLSVHFGILFCPRFLNQPDQRHSSVTRLELLVYKCFYKFKLRKFNKRQTLPVLAARPCVPQRLVPRKPAGLDCSSNPVHLLNCITCRLNRLDV